MNDQNIPLHANAGTKTHSNEEILNRIGQVTRLLHDNLSSLGFDKILAHVATELPNTRDRLNYVTRMTEQAASRVLTATEIATPLQIAISEGASALTPVMMQISDAPSSVDTLPETAKQIQDFLNLANGNAVQTKNLLMDIMMAQDFQDLTGQVIKTIMTLVQDLEQHLLQVLIDFSPLPKNESLNTGLINGPQIDIQKNHTAFSSQTQVDDLLDSLGF